MEPISSLPVPHDMDADYSPQYVKLARILRDKITSGNLKCADSLPASCLAAEYQERAYRRLFPVSMMASRGLRRVRIIHYSHYAASCHAWLGKPCGEGNGGV